MMDDIQHEWITIMGKKGSFRKKFLEEIEGKQQINPRAVSTWLNQMADSRPGSPGDIRGAEMMKTWSRMFDAAKRVVNEVDQSAKFAGVPTAAEDVRSLLERAGTATDVARERAAVTVAKSGLQGRTLLTSHPIITPAESMAGQAVSMLAPSAVSGIVSGTISAAKQAVSVPRTVQVLAALERAGQTVGRKIDSWASTLARAGSRAASVGRAEALAGVASEFAHDAERASAAFTKHAERINTLANNPDAMQAHLEALSDDLSEHAPEVSRAVGLGTVRAVQFLHAKMPKPPDRGPLAPPWTPSRAEIARFQRYAEAVDNPMVILKQAAAGTLTDEAIEAVRVVHPAIYGRIVEGLTKALIAHPNPPFAMRQAIGRIIGQDVDGTRALVAGNQAAMSGAKAREPAPNGAPSGKATPARADSLHVAERTLTPAERAAAR
jgi:hypothetical protein